MNDLENESRARITAMLVRVISELAGGDPGIDWAVSEVCSGVIEFCHGSKVTGSPATAETAMQAALERVTNKDWRLAITKIGQVFEFDARFGDAAPLESGHRNC